MQGYFDEPELTKQAFDDEGYYRIGDAVASPRRVIRPAVSSSTAVSVGRDYPIEKLVNGDGSIDDCRRGPGARAPSRMHSM